MKIVFDMRWTTGDIAGISRYSIQLARALHARDDVELVALVCNDEQAELMEGIAQVRSHDPQSPLGGIQELALAKQLNALRPDVVYSPIFFMGSRGRRYKLVLTIHDMIPFHYPKSPHHLGLLGRVGWRTFYATKHPQRWLLSHADAVATVSQTARDELERDLLDRPVAVIPNCVEQVAPPEWVRNHADSNDIVYMGVFSQHKNVETLIQAIALAPECRLHLLSRIPANRLDELQAFASARGVADRVLFHNGVTDEEYRGLLANARCLVTASRLEGFGLPLIEAQQQGVPVACSDIPIFHEVAGDTVEFFDPTSPRQCADAWGRLKDPARSTELSAAGVVNARRFTADASAEAAMAVFRRVCGAENEA